MNLFFCILVIGVILTTCEASGILYLQLIEFGNPRGLGANGNPCEGNAIFGSIDECDHYFEICLESKKVRKDCDVGFKRTPAIDNKRHIMFKDTAMSQPFTFEAVRVETNFTMDIKVFDKDPHNDDRVGIFSQHVQNIPLGVNNKQPIPKEITLRAIEHNLSLKLKLWAKCKEHFYGVTCTTKCIPRRSPSEGYYTCSKTTGKKICIKPYEGADCKEKNFCQSNPCKNGATCVKNLASQYACQCKEGYNGKQCEIKVPPCKRIQCENSGTCIVTSGQPKCVCKAGFVGSSCQDDLDECKHAAPCQNNGTCENLRGSYKCYCKPEFTGVRCEIKIKKPFAESVLAPVKHEFRIPQWSYYVLAAAARVVAVCIVIVIILIRRKKTHVVRKPVSQAIAYQAALQPTAEDNVYMDGEDSDGTLYEDIDRNLDNMEDNGSDFDNPSYGMGIDDYRGV